MKKIYLLKNVYFSRDNGGGAENDNEGNLGADDAYGYDESDKD